PGADCQAAEPEREDDQHPQDAAVRKAPDQRHDCAGAAGQPVRGDRSRADAVTSACADLPGAQALRGWPASRSCPPASASASPLGCCGCSCLTASAAASAGAGFGAGAGASNRLGEGAFSAAAAVEALLSAAVAAVSGFDRPAAPEVVLSTADSAASGRLVP